MLIDDCIIKNDEKAVFRLRSVYESQGYKRYKMNKFEEYELYVRNKNFLKSDNVITFTDTSGKMMALKPDVTLSIVKSGSDSDELQKVYYNENIYRISHGTGTFKEIMQVGLECIGKVKEEDIKEVILLAANSLEILSEDYILDISDMGVVSEILDKLEISGEKRERVLQCIGEKNSHDILKYTGNALLQRLINTNGAFEEFISLLNEIFDGEFSEHTNKFINIVSELAKSPCAKKIRIDFSVLNDLNYYNGIVFNGFINGVSQSVLSGGQYDRLMKKMGRKSSAIGFAVYFDSLEYYAHESYTCEKEEVLNIALPKGRLGEKVYDMFEKAGFECACIKETNRKLIFENRELKLRYFWVKPSDVAIYVERGAADIGVCGKDILLEYEPDVYELADLNLGKCRMVVASKYDFNDSIQNTLRVATKFSNITRNYYNSKGKNIDIVHLNGSIEIAPVLGLTDVIVDIVETGTTLKENNLKILEEIVPISARLIANKSSLKFKNDRINEINDGITAQTEKIK